MKVFFSYIKLTILFAAITGLLMIMGYLIGGTGGLIVFLFMSIAMNIGTFIFSKSIALRFSGAVPLPKDQYELIYSQTENLTKRMNIPLPELYYSPNEFQPNAFATGRSPKSSAVCFTAGILEQLTPEQIEGVLAHELAHIKNRDTLVSTIFAVIAGAISSIANLGFLFSMFSSNEDNGSPNPFVEILLMIFAPLAATLIQLGISRNREFLADSTAAKYTGHPEHLAEALKRIQYLGQNIPMTENTNPAMASLYISNPFSAEGIMGLFSTHPPVEARVKNLLGR